MDPYELIVEGAKLLIRPQKDGTYLVFRADLKLALLYPEVTLEGIVWETADWIDDNYAATIGKAIEVYEHVDYTFHK